MKYLLVLLVGISIGIGGEWAIPEKYGYGATNVCLKQGEYTFIPQMLIYTDGNEKPYGAYLNHNQLNSYQIIFEYMFNGLKKLSQEDCNKLITQFYLRDEFKL